MAYAQWVYILLQTQAAMSQSNITLQNVHLNWGKFFEYDNKDREVSVDQVQKTSIKPGNQVGIAACGRSDASSGTEGSFEIWDGETKICKVYWDCPWGSKTNTFTVSELNDVYSVEARGANLDSGALGNVTVRISKWA
ncbi:aegerolysin type hemolysin [Emericellopsis atlantica]|uniref:Aegerolysin type hemolysin n=1 Tax=Emericellopsis atlantica TaxID=2614577 RepID=A0A9P7ZKC3_9HYPO|nr:aegerolysin type hemolysin [Emericellopsis atlantica]KAG9253585.1 aegerolysin type hemolysin [Emericellopsis atlantica]